MMAITAIVMLSTSVRRHLAFAPAIHRDSIGQHWKRKIRKKVTM